jgi:AraC family transcriptional regulator
MKPKRRIVYVALGAAVWVLAVSSLAPTALAASNPPQQAKEPFASIQVVKPFVYVCIAHKGPLSEMGTVIGEFMQAMQAQGLFPSIQGPMVGVYFNPPGQVKPEELTWEVGFEVGDQASPKPPLEKKTWTYASVAAAVHIGPYAKASETIQKLMAWVASQGYVAAGPVLERYMNNPMQVKPEELRTEIWIPVKKR